ncbi:BspA family leucine-rich repeat surface protein [Fructilactobacillus myrtifloralis]|uniref:BspA family leucine-rich repeat surface protein n=1 Tax=Fructilactobacillus myrtifloralis TaxID=2940301 RepID=A0ABY5BM48_9LACO|nr:BspA family leucine-rich repeat surface protein [Fructilactobacillus myrtifloralis]USS84692.1 BspA family leucine-rich repeat surface protein [Fructilactobacillus myrtifloralis]
MEPKLHYKMYKAGKFWLFATLTTITLGTGLLLGTQSQVKAATNVQTDQATATPQPESESQTVPAPVAQSTATAQSEVVTEISGSQSSSSQAPAVVTPETTVTSQGTSTSPATSAATATSTSASALQVTSASATQVSATSESGTATSVTADSTATVQPVTTPTVELAATTPAPAAIQTGTWGTAQYTYDDSSKTLTLLGGGELPAGTYSTGNTGTSSCPFPDVRHIVFNGPVSLAATSPFVFAGLSQLEDITNIHYLDTSKVTNIVGMFKDCTALKKLDLSGWNVAKVTSFGAMFRNCTSLTDVNFTGWDTSGAQYFNAMFFDATSLTHLDLSMFNTRNANFTGGGLANMFRGTTSLWNLKLGADTLLYQDAGLANPTTGNAIPNSNKTVAGPSWQLLGNGSDLNPLGKWVAAQVLLDGQAHPNQYVWAQTTNTKIIYVDNDNQDQSVGTGLELGYQAPGIEITQPVHQNIPKGYHLSDPTATYQNGVAGTVDKDGLQTIYVGLKHNLKELTPDSPGVPGQPIDPSNPDGTKWPDGSTGEHLNTENSVTIHYQYPDGRSAAPDAVKQVQFTRNATVDEVTGKITYGAWTPVGSATITIDSPTINGYTPDQNQVTTTVTAGQDSNATVTYQANDVQATIKLIDDTTGTTIATQTVTGKTDAQLNNPIDLQALKNKGYIIGSNNVPGTFGPNADQTYEIHVTQGTSQITPDKPGIPGQPIDPNNPEGPKWPAGTSVEQLQTENSVTVHYRYADGRQAAPGAIKKVRFTRMATVNHVTGVVTYGEWTPVGSAMVTITSPRIDGYTPDHSQITTTVTAGQDSKQTVVYNANDVQATIKVIDDTTGQTIDTQTVNGKIGNSLTNPVDLQALKNKGYVIGSNNVPTIFGSDAEQTYEIHVTHGSVTGTPDNPGNPGQPIDPNNPDGPKWPEGTAAEQLQTESTITVHYKYADGSQAAPDATRTVKFTRTVTVDMVTGQVTYGAWTPIDSTEVTITSPRIDGYTPDQEQVSVTATAGNNSNQTVTYAQNPLIVQPIDKDGNPVGPAYPTDPKQPQPQEIPGYQFDHFETKAGKTYAVYTKDDTPAAKDDQMTVQPIDEQGNPVGPAYPTGAEHPQVPTIPSYRFKEFQTKAGKTFAVYAQNTSQAPEAAKPQAGKPQTQLPQTGQTQHRFLGLMGMLLTTLAGLFGFGKLKQRKE